jgi:hypothetical protein
VIPDSVEEKFSQKDPICIFSHEEGEKRENNTLTKLYSLKIITRIVLNLFHY